MKQKCLYIGQALAALIFLFNPPISVVDILPDFIGYLLLMSAIRNAAEVFPHFDEAYSGFSRAFWVSLAKIPAFIVMMSIVSANSYERAIITVFSLGFAVLELIFVLGAFRSFFAALTHLGEREGLLPVLKAGRSKRGIDGVSDVTLAFLITKALCSFLPELSLISVFETLGSLDAGAINPARLYPVFVMLASVVGFAMGGVWLYFTFSYLKDLKNSTVMQEFFMEKEALHADLFMRRASVRREKLSFFLLTLALLLSFDIVLDGKSYLPDVFSALLLIFPFLILRREHRLYPIGALCAALYGICSVVLDIFSKRFLAEYTYTDVYRKAEAETAYLPIKVLGVLEALLLIGTLLLLFLLLRAFIRNHAADRLSEGNRAIARGVKREFTLKAAIFTALGALPAVFYAVEKFLLVLMRRHVISADEANQFYEEGRVLYIPIFGGSWLIGTLLTALWVCYGIYFISSLRAELYTREE